METKKSKKASLENKRPLFFELGIIIGLSISFVAFEWKSYYTKAEVENKKPVDWMEEEIIPITFIQQLPITPPAPKPKGEEISIVDDKKILIEGENIPTKKEEITFIEVSNKDEILEDEPEILLQSEAMPEFPGGINAMFNYLAKNTRYPNKAREEGIQGTVFLTFVVGSDGKIKNVSVLRGIGGGCDEEAIRVVSSMPTWKPGKQGGKFVSVQFNLPYSFKLK